MGFVYAGLLYGCLALHGAMAVSPAADATLDASSLLRAVDFLFVVWIAPNLVRTVSLHFVSSNMHYFGDIEKGNILKQTQVLNRWYLAPLQLFCMNFGSKHGIHHFHVPDPFYMRQLTARTAHRVMRENGVRFNDMASLRRANRYTLGVADERRAAAIPGRTSLATA